MITSYLNIVLEKDLHNTTVNAYVKIEIFASIKNTTIKEIIFNFNKQ